jgi:hypothetical protein
MTAEREMNSPGSGQVIEERYCLYGNERLGSILDVKRLD